MTPDEVLAGLAEILGGIARVDPGDVTAATPFVDLGLDSLTMVDVIVAAEDRFGVLIADDDWSRLETVGDAVAYIARGAAIGPV